MRPFDNWTTEEVEEVFGLTESENLPFLHEWLSAGEIPLSEDDLSDLEKLRLRLAKWADSWNEDELKMRFIAPLLEVANLDSPAYSIFSQRPLSVRKEGEIIASGRVDFMLARGKATPKQPYFCLHEYKPERRKETEPRGQLLIAMVAAQQANHSQMPVYGVYLVGRLWFFVTLENMQHAVSKSFDSTDETHAMDILRILRKGKILIEAHAAAIGVKA